MSRPKGHSAINAAKTHCPRGHPLSGGNVRLNKRGSRECRACRRESGRRARAARGVVPRTGLCKYGHDRTLGGALYKNGSCVICAKAQEEARRRAQGIGPKKPRVTVCGRGHDLTDPANVRSSGKGCAECHRLDARARYWRDPAAAVATAVAWQRANREQYRANMRRAKLLRHVGRDATAVAYATVLDCDPCSYCGAPSGTVDHIVPVHHGGSNAWENLTAACKSCNSRKAARPLLDYLLLHQSDACVPVRRR